MSRHQRAASNLYKSRIFIREKKPSAPKREHPALQNIKILYFFPHLWAIFALLDPRILQLKLNADPDPQPWLVHPQFWAQIFKKITKL
jgi:hypothetical protein